MDILYEDKNMISLVKPVGYLCEENSQKNNLPAFIREHTLANGETGGVYVVHRLDVLTSGVMVYAKNKFCAKKLSELVCDHSKFIKEYLTVVEGKPQEKVGEYIDFLFKDSSKNKSFVVKKMRKGVKEAKLSYEVLAEKSINGKTYSLLKIRLFTGRTHQIRVQLSSRKMPILGDGKYGSKNSNCDLALFSHKIKFTNPCDNKELAFEALPDFQKYPWNIFGEEKDRL